MEQIPVLTDEEISFLKGFCEQYGGDVADRVQRIICRLGEEMANRDAEIKKLRESIRVKDASIEVLMGAVLAE